MTRKRVILSTFKSVLLGKHKTADYEYMILKMTHYYQELGAHMSPKLHFLHAHLEYFPSNSGDYTEKEGERFHEDIKTMEQRYQVSWNCAMLADYCWYLKRYGECVSHRR